MSRSREFEFTDHDFQRIRTLIREHAGIALADSKQELVYSRLARRLRATGLMTFGEYLALLQRGDAIEWESFINSLTTNLTSFFREAHHFTLLAEHLRKLDRLMCLNSIMRCNSGRTRKQPASAGVKKRSIRCADSLATVSAL